MYHFSVKRLNNALVRVILPSSKMLSFCPELRFSRKRENDGAQRRRFWHASVYIISELLLKRLAPAHLRSGHQISSSFATSENHS